MDEVIEDEVCSVNIGPEQIRKRMTMGLAMLGVAAVLVAGLIAIGAPVWWRIGGFLPALAGGAGVFQAREKT